MLRNKDQECNNPLASFATCLCRQRSELRTHKKARARLNLSMYNLVFSSSSDVKKQRVGFGKIYMIKNRSTFLNKNVGSARKK